MVASPQNEVYIHHLTASDTSKSGFNPFNSAGGSLGIGVMGSAYFGDRGKDSGETSTMFAAKNASSMSGFHLKPTNALMVQTDLVSYSTEDKNLYLILEVEYLPGLQEKDIYATLKTAGSLGEFCICQLIDVTITLLQEVR
jgi:hypothetical protein